MYARLPAEARQTRGKPSVGARPWLRTSVRPASRKSTLVEAMNRIDELPPFAFVEPTSVAYKAAA